MNSNPFVVVRTRVVGFHRWPTPTTHRAYLGQRHRHEFHVEARVEAKNDDREIECHDMKKVVDFALRSVSAPDVDGRDFGDMSCEAIARDVAESLQQGYPKREVVVSVLEDGEVGAEVRLGSAKLTDRISFTPASQAAAAAATNLKTITKATMVFVKDERGDAHALNIIPMHRGFTINYDGSV